MKPEARERRAGRPKRETATVNLASAQRSGHSSFRSRAGPAENWRWATRPYRAISPMSSSSSPAVIVSIASARPLGGGSPAWSKR